MKKLIILFIILLAGEAEAATISKVDNALGKYHQLVRVGNIVYAAFDKLTIALADYSGTNNIALKTNGWYFPAGM